MMIRRSDSLENAKAVAARSLQRHAGFVGRSSYKLPSYILPGPGDVAAGAIEFFTSARSLVICCRR